MLFSEHIHFSINVKNRIYTALVDVTIEHISCIAPCNVLQYGNDRGNILPLNTAKLYSQERRMIMKKWNKLIALGMISVVLAAQAAGCGSKQEEESSLPDTIERDKDMEALAENSAESDGIDVSEPDYTGWEEAEFEDHVMDWKGQDDLEACMRKYTCITEGDIMLSDVYGLGKVELFHASVTDLSPLQELKNLELLYFDDTTFNPGDVSELKQVKTLYIVNCGISDISFLSEMTNLKHLCLNGNDISDLTPLSGLTNLESIQLKDNNISDVSPLAGLTNLLLLELKGNEGITDYSAVSFVKDLRYDGMEQ